MIEPQVGVTASCRVVPLRSNPEGSGRRRGCLAAAEKPWKDRLLVMFGAPEAEPGELSATPTPRSV